MTIATDSNMNLGDIMKYELNVYLTALFKTPKILRKTDKY